MNKKKLFTDINAKWKDYRLGENTFDQNKIKQVADLYTQFLIGNSNTAIKKLEKLASGASGRFLRTTKPFINPNTGNEYNKVFIQLYSDIYNVLVKNLKDL